MPRRIQSGSTKRSSSSPICPVTKQRREADDSVIEDGDADSAVRDSTVGELECVGMGEQARSIAFVRERRSSKHITECRHVFHRCTTKAKVGQVGGDHVARVPDAAEWDLCGGSVGMARRWVGGRWPPHVEDREWPTAVVEGRAADDYEAERLVEAARRGVLLVDVDRQVAVA
jgi:hypothetical protein